MKNFFVLTSIIVFSCSLILSAQIDLGKVLKKSKKEAEKKVESKIGENINKGVNKTLDEAEKEVTGKDKNNKPAEKNAAAKNEVTRNISDFVPGKTVIFDDNLASEKIGDFPSKWDMTKGIYEVASLNNQNVILFLKCNFNAQEGIIPVLQNSNEDYLPDEFTIEFDAYFEKENAQYKISLLDFKNQIALNKPADVNNMFFRFEQNSSDGAKISANSFPVADKKKKPEPGWRHLALAFNKKAVKTYIDNVRILNIPNINYNPTGITLSFNNSSGNLKGYIKNFRLAK